MKFLFSMDEFVNEELTKHKSEYKYTKNKEEDIKHNRLASKNDDGHHWKMGKKKFDKDDKMTQICTCECGYKKKIEQDKDKSVMVTYTKS
jgi:hypothetical protein